MNTQTTDASCDTVSIFTSKISQSSNEVTAFDDAEVFAPRLRQPVLEAAIGTKRNVVVVRHGWQPPPSPTAFSTDLEITRWWCGSTLDFPSKHKYEQSMSYEDSLQPPSWLRIVLDSMAKRWGIGKGWDTYDAKPTNSQYADQLLDYLSKIMLEEYKAPIITPLTDGGLQAEWHGSGKDFEIVISAEEPARYYYFNAEAEEEEGEELDKQDLTYVRKFIASFK